MTSAVVDSIIAALKKEAAEQVIKKLAAKSAFFSSWFMSPILSFIVPIVIDELYDKSALGINWLWIIIENKKELKDAIRTREELLSLLRNGQDTTQAEDEFNEAADSLIKRNNGHLPR